MPERLAFVVPWYGADLPGDAERDCRATARALAARGVPVEILTTCARDAASAWVDHHPPGLTEEDGLPVRRFRLRPRDARRYFRLDARLRLRGALDAGEDRDFVEESVHSDELYGYLAAERARCWYAFLPHAAGTTWEGALVAPERSILIPRLADSPVARLGATRRVLRAVRAVCFHAGPERALGEAIAGGDPGTFALVPEGADAGLGGDRHRFQAKYRVRDPFLLYVGRRAAETNTPLLLEYFARYRFTRPTRPLKLVLMGWENVRVPERLARDVRDAGLAPAPDAYDACAAAVALCQPSRREDFSIAMIEGWLCGAPALVHGGCPATRDHCLASNGGLFFDEYFDFAEAVDRLLDDPALGRRLGDSGRAYALAHFTWDRVTAGYLELLRRLGARLP